MLIRKDDLDKNVKDAIIDIAKKYGTPFYIYSFDKIESKIALLKDAVKSKIKSNVNTTNIRSASMPDTAQIIFAFFDFSPDFVIQPSYIKSNNFFIKSCAFMYSLTYIFNYVNIGGMAFIFIRK